MNQFFAPVLNPWFSCLLQQVLLYCPSQFHMLLTWELRKMFILPGFSSCLCSEQFPRREALLWRNSTSEGVFKPIVGAMSSHYVGTACEMIMKLWSLVMKMTQSRYVNFYYHFPDSSCLAKITITPQQPCILLPSSCSIVGHRDPGPSEGSPSRSVFKCSVYLVLECSKTEPLH